MSTILSKEDIRQLMQHHDDPCVSVYVATDPAASRTLQGPVRLRKMLDEVESQLLEAGLRRPDTEKLLLPARSLQETSDAWRSQAGGLAFFLSPALVQYHQLPLRFEDLYVIARRFHTRPLAPLLTGDSRCFVLALSKNHVRLLEATRDGVKEVSLGNTPTSLAEALRYDESEKQLQFHTVSSGAPGGTRDSQYHGQGTGIDESKNELLRFFQQIDAGLTRLLTGEQAPLVLAAVDYLHALYRDANHYPMLVSGELVGNPDLLSARTLQEQALEVVTPIFRKERSAAISVYHDRIAHGLASSNIHEIAPAACAGRVQTLFMLQGEHLWGAFDDESFTIQMEPAPTAENEDLLDLAAAQTFLHGGDVYVLTAEEMPDQTSIAAVLRF